MSLCCLCLAPGDAVWLHFAGVIRGQGKCVRTYSENHLGSIGSGNETKRFTCAKATAMHRAERRTPQRQGLPGQFVFEIAGCPPAYCRLAWSPWEAHAFRHAFIQACMHACMHAFLHAFLHAFMDAFVHRFLHVGVHAFMHLCIHACMHACMYVSMHVTDLLRQRQHRKNADMKGW